MSRASLALQKERVPHPHLCTACGCIVCRSETRSAIQPCSLVNASTWLWTTLRRQHARDFFRLPPLIFQTPKVGAALPPPDPRRATICARFQLDPRSTNSPRSARSHVHVTPRFLFDGLCCGIGAIRKSSIELARGAVLAGHSFVGWERRIEQQRAARSNASWSPRPHRSSPRLRPEPTSTPRHAAQATRLQTRQQPPHAQVHGQSDGPHEHRHQDRNRK